MVLESDSATSLREHMVEHHIRRRGIVARAVLDAMGRVPRERFVPEVLAGAAYEDRALEIGQGQTISQPFIVAYMTARLDVQRHHRVLEIGTGSGYQTAILSLLCRTVYTIETLPVLANLARSRLLDLGRNNCCFRAADGTCGWPEEAPFDRIIVTAGAPGIPPPLVDQLHVGGKMVLPVGDEREQRLVVVEKRERRFVEQVLIACRFVKLIGQHGWAAPSPPATDNN